MLNQRIDTVSHQAAKVSDFITPHKNGMWMSLIKCYRIIPLFSRYEEWISRILILRTLLVGVCIAPVSLQLNRLPSWLIILNR